MVDFVLFFDLLCSVCDWSLVSVVLGLLLLLL